MMIVSVGVASVECWPVPVLMLGVDHQQKQQQQQQQQQQRQQRQQKTPSNKPTCAQHAAEVAASNGHFSVRKCTEAKLPRPVLLPPPTSGLSSALASPLAAADKTCHHAVKQEHSQTTVSITVNDQSRTQQPKIAQPITTA
jgi:hypothetical protein